MSEREKKKSLLGIEESCLWIKLTWSQKTTLKSLFSPIHGEHSVQQGLPNLPERGVLMTPFPSIMARMQSKSFLSLESSCGDIFVFTCFSATCMWTARTSKEPLKDSPFSSLHPMWSTIVFQEPIKHRNENSSHRMRLGSFVSLMHKVYSFIKFVNLSNMSCFYKACLLIGLLNTGEQFQSKNKDNMCKISSINPCVAKGFQVKNKTCKVAANLLSIPHMPNLGFYFSRSCITDVKSTTFPKRV